jgi:hypothetical protein
MNRTGKPKNYGQDKVDDKMLAQPVDQEHGQRWDENAEYDD